MTNNISKIISQNEKQIPEGKSSKKMDPHNAYAYTTTYGMCADT